MKFSLFISAPLFLTLAASAQTNNPAGANTRPLTMEESIDMALHHNFDVQIQRFDPRLALYTLQMAYGGYDPQFTASGEHDYTRTASLTNTPPDVERSDVLNAGLNGSLPWGMSYNLQGNLSDNTGINWSGPGAFSPIDNSQGSQASIMLSQPLLKNLWIDETRMTISVDKNRVKYSEQALRLQLITSLAAVQTAYYELIYAGENVKVQEQALQLAQQLYDEDKKRVEVGTLAPLDEKQAESQVAAQRAAVLAAQQTLVDDENTLKNLITDDYGKMHDVDLQPTASFTAVKQVFNLQDSWNQGLTLRPDLLQAKLDLEKAGIQLKYYKNQVYPELDIYGTYGRAGYSPDYAGAISDVRENDEPFYDYGIRFSIPLGNVAARNQYKQGKLTEEQALLAVKQLEQNVMVQIDDAIKNADAAYERVGATHDASLYAQDALDAEEKKLENGKSTSFIVLQLQTDLTTARSAEIRALADYNEALVQLDQDQGSTLNTLRIDVQMR
jgi:outer membrane protein TolC